MVFVECLVECLHTLYLLVFKVFMRRWNSGMVDQIILEKVSSRLAFKKKLYLFISNFFLPLIDNFLHCCRHCHHHLIRNVTLFDKGSAMLFAFSIRINKIDHKGLSLFFLKICKSLSLFFPSFYIMIRCLLNYIL